MTIGYIYKIVNLVNEKVYIGKTANPKKRWQGHKDAAKANKDHRKIVSAMRKYGVDMFSMEIIASVLDYDKDSNYLEKLIILEYESYEKGYNSTRGGESAPTGKRSSRTDYSGLIFGHLTILSDAPDVLTENGNKTRMIVCRCVCGNVREFGLSNVLQGKIKSCGCSRPKAHNFINREGKRYGNLVVLKDSDTASGKRSFRKALCKCDCGNIKLIQVANMVSGKIKTCGCKIHMVRKVSVHGTVYNSYRDAATHIGVNEKTILRWMKSKPTEVFYIDNPPQPEV